MIAPRDRSHGHRASADTAHAWGVWGLVGCLLVGCGQTRAGDPAEGGDTSAAGMAGSGSASSGAGGRPPIIIDPVTTEPLAPVPHDSCACPGVGFGLMALLGEDTQQLPFNIADSSACAPDQAAHASVTSGCGDDVSLALSADAAGGIPRLMIQGRQLTYTDTANLTWTGFMPRSLDSRPDQSGVLVGSLALPVVSAAGEERALQLTFKLCAEWTQSRAPC